MRCVGKATERFELPCAADLSSSGGGDVLYLVAFKSSSEAAKADAAAYLASISESCWHEFDGIWFVKSDKQPVEIRDRLRFLSGPNDGVAVALLAGFAAWHGFDSDVQKWLLQNL